VPDLEGPNLWYNFDGASRRTRRLELRCHCSLTISNFGSSPLSWIWSEVISIISQPLRALSTQACQM